MAKKSLPARTAVRTKAMVDFAIHTDGDTHYKVQTLNVNGVGVPQLSISDNAIACSVFFETTDQVEVLARVLSDYLKRNEVKRPNAA